MRRILFLIGSAFWLLLALIFAALFVQGLTNSSSPGLFRLIFWSNSIAMDLIHEMGFCVAAIFCLAISAGLWAYGMTHDCERKKPDDNA